MAQWVTILIIHLTLSCEEKHFFSQFQRFSCSMIEQGTPENGWGFYLFFHNIQFSSTSLWLHPAHHIFLFSFFGLFLSVCVWHFPSHRFLFRTLQGTLFPTQLQLGRQLSRLPAEARNQLFNRWNTRKDTSPHQPPSVPSSPESPYFIASNSLLKACNQNSSTGPSRHGNDPIQPPKTKTESGKGLNIPLGAQVCEENGNSSVAPRQETPVDSELEPAPLEESLHWNPMGDLSDISLLNWITSTPLFNDIGRDSPWSSSNLQNVRQDNTALGSFSSPQDSRGVTEQNSVCFPEQTKGSADGCFKAESLETTFLWQQTFSICIIFSYLHRRAIALVVSKDEAGNQRYIIVF